VLILRRFPAGERYWQAPQAEGRAA
jgi:hypothetical protein